MRLFFKLEAFNCKVSFYRLEATFHSTIINIPMRPLREDQTHR